MLANDDNLRRAESEIVASCLATPDRIVEVGYLPAEWFVDPRCRKAWRAMVQLFGDGERVDPWTVAEAAPPLDVTELSAFCAEAPLGADLRGLAESIREAAITRRVLVALEEIKTRQRREDLRGADFLSAAIAELGKIHVLDDDAPQPMGLVVRDRLRQIMEQVDAKEKGELESPGIMTGIEKLDELLGGLKRRRITLLAARPSMGKSAVARQIADHASQRGRPVHAFSMEDPIEATADRNLSAASGIPACDLETLDNLGRAEIGQLLTAADSFGKRANWLVDKRSGLPIDEIIRSVRAWRPRLKTELVVIDYIGLVKRGFRETQKDMLDRSMKALLASARKDDLAYLVLSQLNRDCESRENKRPILKDLKDSGSLEEEAKTVLFLHREHKYDAGADPAEAEVIVAKNQNGKTGIARATWHGPTMRIF